MPGIPPNALSLLKSKFKAMLKGGSKKSKKDSSDTTAPATVPAASSPAPVAVAAAAVGVAAATGTGSSALATGAVPQTTTEAKPAAETQKETAGADPVKGESVPNTVAAAAPVPVVSETKVAEPIKAEDAEAGKAKTAEVTDPAITPAAEATSSVVKPVTEPIQNKSDPIHAVKPAETSAEPIMSEPVTTAAGPEIIETKTEEKIEETKPEAEKIVSGAAAVPSPEATPAEEPNTEEKKENVAKTETEKSEVPVVAAGAV